MTNMSEGTSMAATAKITRKQLVDAVEAGIARVEDRWDFTADDAVALRSVAATESLVARGHYSLPLGDGRVARCPVSRAFPDYWYLNWDMEFARGFDKATRVHMTPSASWILEVVDGERA